MKFIANAINGEFLENILPSADDGVDEVLAAIAYGSVFNNQKDDFIGHCLKHHYRLDIWMRYDHTVPVAVELLKRLLKHKADNIFCRLIPDHLHAKVIWWKGYGAYIGSANLSDRAWTSNIEAGLFLTESDLQRDGMDIELEEFFDELRALPVARELDVDIIKEQEEIAALRANAWNLGKANRQQIPEWDGLLNRSRAKGIARRRERFRQEWQNTLAYLSHIAEVLKSHRPSWVPKDTPINWQVDQFLHAFYYNKLSEGRAKPYGEFYERNRRAPNAALLEAATWWAATTSAPSNEDIALIENAPLVRNMLAAEKILDISDLEFAAVCERIHASREHVIHIEAPLFGRRKGDVLTLGERIPLYANWLLRQQNKKGWSVLELLNYVLYGGSDDEVWARLFEAHADRDTQFPRYKLNTLAEIVGWVRPDVAPPRNGRTSKALRALGYDVKIY